MKRKQKVVVSITIFLCLLFTSFGYAALNTELSISGEAYVRVDSEIRITDLKLSSKTDGAYETYNSKYSKDTASMFVNLPANGSAIYELAITNNSSSDYYLKALNGSNTSYELLDSKIYDVFSPNSTKTIRIKITNTSSASKTVSLNLDYEFAKDANPTIALGNLPSWNTKGDAYAVTPTYNAGPSGGSASCKSNINTGIANVTNLSQLTTGTHNITCTVKSNTGKTASVTKSTKITYDPYSTTNMIANSSFESTDLRNYYTVANNQPYTVTSEKKYSGNYSLKCNLSNYDAVSDSRMAQLVTLKKNHKYYAFEMVNRTNYVDKNIWTGEFDMFREGGTILGYPEYGNISLTSLGINLGWQKLSFAFHNDNDCLYNFRLGYYIFTVPTFNITIYYDNLMLIDLTETFGAGLEPSYNWCNKHIKHFDGTTTIYK